MTIAALPRILALAPQGIKGIGVVASACRASALGIIDLSSEPQGDVAAALDGLGRLTANPFGVRTTIRGIAIFANCSPAPSGLSVVCIPVEQEEKVAFEGCVRHQREIGRFVLAEVTSRADARRAIEAGASGLIVTGNEAAGFGGAESSFVLMQGVLAFASVPVWVRGGIGPHVAAGCIAAGAAGVVLDGALLLARESPLEPEWRAQIARFDGSETTVVTGASGPGLRVFARPGAPAISRIRQAAALGAAQWEDAVAQEVGWKKGQCIPVGQDAALADRLAHRFVTVGGIVQEFERSITEGISAARQAQPLAEGSTLAEALGTRFPILQGPMTRVSDVAAFAEVVAREGALPFLALALLRGPEVRALLDDIAGRLLSAPWGVGILGFVPPDLRSEQLAAVREVRPPYALIAGGRRTRRRP